MKLDKFEPSQSEVVKAMFDLSEIKAGEKHIELGSGNGQFVVEAIKRGAESIGYEIVKKLADESIKKHGINVINKDCFEVDVSQADVITCWFTLLPETRLLMDKLHNEMKTGARLVKEGFTSHGFTNHDWKPVENTSLTTYTKEIFQGQKILRVKGEIVCLYIK